MRNSSVTAILFAIVVSTSSCQNIRPWLEESQKPASHHTDTKSLLLGLCEVNEGKSTGAQEREAGRLAAAAEQTARELAAEYQVFTPAWLHNCQVNLGLKRRGLCWHYMEDLYLALRREQPKYFVLHSAVRDDGNFFLEHNAVVITASGQPFASGLVLDPWKKPGTLQVMPVNADKRPWTSQPGYRQELESRFAAAAAIPPHLQP